MLLGSPSVLFAVLEIAYRNPDVSADSDAAFGSSRSIHLTVDGEPWEVIANGEQLDFNWLRGAAEPYGFSSRPVPTGVVLPIQQLEGMIREFMSNVNPETGYLD